MFFTPLDESDNEAVAFANIFAFSTACLMAASGFAKALSNSSTAPCLPAAAAGICSSNKTIKSACSAATTECPCCFAAVFSASFTRKARALPSCAGKINEKFIHYSY